MFKSQTPNTKSQNSSAASPKRGQSVCQRRLGARARFSITSCAGLSPAEDLGKNLFNRCNNRDKRDDHQLKSLLQDQEQRAKQPQFDRTDGCASHYEPSETIFGNFIAGTIFGVGLARLI